jgi:hypothetical protein
LLLWYWTNTDVYDFDFLLPCHCLMSLHYSNAARDCRWTLTLIITSKMLSSSMNILISCFGRPFLCLRDTVTRPSYCTALECCDIQIERFLFLVSFNSALNWDQPWSEPLSPSEFLLTAKEKKALTVRSVLFFNIRWFAK